MSIEVNGIANIAILLERLEDSSEVKEEILKQLALLKKYMLHHSQNSDIKWHEIREMYPDITPEDLYNNDLKTIPEKEISDQAILSKIVQDLRTVDFTDGSPYVILETTLVRGSKEHKLWQELHLPKYPENY